MKRSTTCLRVAAILFAFGLGLAQVARAQNTDFTGTYNFDQAKSQGKPEPVSLAGGEAPEVTSEGQFAAGGGGGAFGAQAAGGRQGAAPNPLRLVIKQSAMDINILDGGVPLMFKLD